MSYRSRGVTKRSGRKIRRYTNLREFNRECPSRGVRGNICTVTNTRKLQDGSGLATIRSERGPVKGRKPGTWTLHFADYSVMKRHLIPRVLTEGRGALFGSKRRKRKR